MKSITHSKFVLLGFIVVALLAACRGQAGPPTATPVPTPDESVRQLRTFEALWQAVNEHLVYADFAGVDWDSAGEKYRGQVEAGLSTDEFNQAMQAMLAELPPGLARFESRQARIEAETADTSNYQGIGAFVAFREEPEPHVVLLVVMEGSPAEAAGLRNHDSIYAVDGEPVRLEEGLGVISRVRGPAGTSVTLTVQSPDGERRDVSVTRGTITASETLRGGRLTGINIGYLRVPPSPDEQLATLFAQALASFGEEPPIEGLVIDLRVAGSGGNWPLEELLTLFGDGPVGEFYTRTDATPQSITGRDLTGSQTVPLAILIGPDTQGVPEIFASALHAMERATLVGLPTPGDVELPGEFPLPDGSRAFIATSSFRALDGLELGLEGLTPDVKVDADWDQVIPEQDPVLTAAVQELTK